MNEPRPFVLFGPDHVAALVITLAACLLLPAAGRRLRSDVQYLGGIVIALALLLHEAAKLLLVGGYGFPLAQSLPLHLCDLATFLLAYVLFTRSARAHEVAYFWGLAGSAPAVLMPDLREGFPHPFYCSFFFGHGMVLLSTLYATCVYRLRPRLRSIPLTLGVTVGVAALMIPVNWLLETNYFYLCAKPAGASLMDYLGPWPWYLLGITGLAALLCLVCYLPFLIADRRRSRTDGTGMLVD